MAQMVGPQCRAHHTLRHQALANSYPLGRCCHVELPPPVVGFGLVASTVGRNDSEELLLQYPSFIIGR